MNKNTHAGINSRSDRDSHRSRTVTLTGSNPCRPQPLRHSPQLTFPPRWPRIGPNHLGARRGGSLTSPVRTLIVGYHALIPPP
jgi:hypothetical protein